MIITCFDSKIQKYVNPKFFIEDNTLIDKLKEESWNEEELEYQDSNGCGINLDNIVFASKSLKDDFSFFVCINYSKDSLFGLEVICLDEKTNEIFYYTFFDFVKEVMFPVEHLIFNIKLKKNNEVLIIERSSFGKLTKEVAAIG